jgi:hypothetical protein
MKRHMSVTAIAIAVVLTVVTSMTLSARSSTVIAQGSDQISGVAYFAEPGECTHSEGLGSDFALRMTGDLQGCYYVFVYTANCSAGGTYRETGAEIFVGQYKGEFGTFGTTYQFEAKYEDCSNLSGEIFGRCEHPLTQNIGTGVFDGFTGRIDFKDDVQAGNFPYRGHLRE